MHVNAATDRQQKLPEEIRIWESPNTVTKIAIDESLLQSISRRVAERCDALAMDSEDSGQLTRRFCTPAMKAAHDRIGGWMQATGMECELDAVGNFIGRFTRSNNEAVLMIGSHLDSVVNGGRFDGMLGVLLGLGVVELFAESKHELPFDIHVVGFSEEEGVRFRFPFIGSFGITGTFDPKDFARTDEDGVTIGEALAEFGCDPKDLSSAAYADRNLIGFMEAHIEQAVLLEEADLPVGVVSAIAGQTRANIEFVGMAGHAGTVPHDRRQDALAAAAELILKIEQLGQQTEGLYATVGYVVASPGLSNVISGRAELRLDLRHEFDAERTTAFEKISNLIKTIAQSRGVTGSIVSAEHTPAVPMDKDLSGHLETAMVECGLKARTMVSGAGHDAMVMSRIVPSCMLFVRCRDGISHHPSEFVSPADIQSALKVMFGAIANLAQVIPET